CDRREVALRIERKRAVKALVRGEDAVVAEEPGIPVWRALRDRLPGNIAASPRPILDHDLLVPSLRDLLPEGAGDDVARAARREPHDEMHGLLGKAFGVRERRRKRQQESRNPRHPVPHRPHDTQGRPRRASLRMPVSMPSAPNVSPLMQRLSAYIAGALRKPLPAP